MIVAWPGALLRRHDVQLFLTSFLGLYAELLCIRWMPAHVRFLSYFTNFILLASFLGLGVGILSVRSQRKLPLGPRTFPLLLLFAAILIAVTKFELKIGSAGVLYYGAGESGTIPVPAAIANAVEDALRKRNPDIVVDRLPITPDRIVEMLDPGN